MNCDPRVHAQLTPENHPCFTIADCLYTDAGRVRIDLSEVMMDINDDLDHLNPTDLIIDVIDTIGWNMMDHQFGTAIYTGPDMIMYVIDWQTAAGSVQFAMRPLDWIDEFDLFESRTDKNSE